MRCNDKGIYVCDCCQGENRIIRTIELYEVCPKCNGDGSKDWIENSMGRKGKEYNKNLQYQISQQNIVELEGAIREEGLKMGHSVSVEVKFIERLREDYYNDLARSYFS